MPVTSAEKIITPAPTDGYALTADLARMGDSITQLVKAASSTERDALAAQRVTNGRAITTADPMFVWRTDLGLLEYSENGTAWTTLAAKGISASFTLNTGLWNPTGTTELKRAGLTWWLSLGFIQKAAGPISGAGWTSVGTVGAEARVAAGGIFMGAARVSAPDNAAISRINRATGAVEILATVASGTTSTSYNLGITWPAV